LAVAFQFGFAVRGGRVKSHAVMHSSFINNFLLKEIL